jgi:hypothetical protein
MSSLFLNGNPPKQQPEIQGADGNPPKQQPEMQGAGFRAKNNIRDSRTGE